MDSKDSKRGFSGLSDLSSDISGSDHSTRPNVASEPTQHKLPQSKHSASNGNECKSVDPIAAVEIKKIAKPSGNPYLKWGLSISAIIIVIWIILIIGSNTNSPSYNTTQSFEVPNQTSIPEQTNIQYEMPPLGTQNILNYKEICWCVRQGIRLDTIRNYVNTDSGANEFNRRVNEYNNRCGNFKYHIGDLERAQRDVEVYRNEIVAEAIDDARVLNGSPRVSDIPQNIPQQEYVSKKPAVKNRKSRNQQITDPVIRKRLSPPSEEHAKVLYPEIRLQDPPKQRRPLQLSDLTPDQQAAVELSCFEAKTKGQFLFDECVKRKLAGKK